MADITTTMKSLGIYVEEGRGIKMAVRYRLRTTYLLGFDSPGPAYCYHAIRQKRKYKHRAKIHAGRLERRMKLHEKRIHVFNVQNIYICAQGDFHSGVRQFLYRQEHNVLAS